MGKARERREKRNRRGRAVKDRRERESGRWERGRGRKERAGIVVPAVYDRRDGKIGWGEKRRRGKERTGGRRRVEGANPGPPSLAPSGGARIRFNASSEQKAPNDTEGKKRGEGKRGVARVVGLRVPC